MTSHRYGELSGLNGSLSERQDSMFDRYLEEMKPFVLRLPHKSGKQINYNVDCKSVITTDYTVCTRSLSAVSMFC